jgi:hypothetical protein
MKALPRSLSSARFAIGYDFQPGDQKKVDNLERIVTTILVVHDDGPSTGREGHPFGVIDEDGPSIGQMNMKRPKGTRLIESSDLSRRHSAISPPIRL